MVRPAAAGFVSLDGGEGATDVEQAGAGLTTCAGAAHGRGRDTRAICRARREAETEENEEDIACCVYVCVRVM